MNKRNQYCRYCAFCFEADDFRCSAMPDGKELHMSEAEIKRQNNCKYFVLSDLGCVITGRQYKPRQYKTRDNNKYNSNDKQLSFEW